MQKIINPISAACLVMVVLLPGCTCKNPPPKCPLSAAAALPVVTTDMTNQPASVPATTTNQAARLIVKWRVAPQTPEAVALRTKIAATTVQVFKGIGDGRMEVVLLPDDRKCTEAIKELEASGLVEYAELDAKVKANKP